MNNDLCINIIISLECTIYNRSNYVILKHMHLYYKHRSNSDLYLILL